MLVKFAYAVRNFFFARQCRRARRLLTMEGARVEIETLQRFRGEAA